MKYNILLLISIVLISAGTLFAQNIIISDHGTAIPNNGNVYYMCDYNSIIEGHLSITNNSSYSMDIKVKKIEQSIVSGSSNYFCWSECYSPFVFVSPSSLPIAAGQTDSSNFIIDYMPMGAAGTSIITYVIFNENNPNDSAAVNVHFYGSPTGINTAFFSQVSLLNAYPNPARNTVSFDYSIPAEASSSQIVIRDIVGNIVKQSNISPVSGKAVFAIDELSSGIYFYSLIVNNEVYATRKLVIRK